MNHCALSRGFSIKEKIFAQVSFFGILITGTIGIILSDPIFVVPYVFIAWYGVPGIIQRHIVCPRCPHLHQFGDCLQLSPQLTRMLIKKQKEPRLSSREKIVFRLIFILIPTYPIYWLLDSPFLLILFTFSNAFWYGGQFLYFCKRCRIYDCPFNLVEIKEPSSAF